MPAKSSPRSNPTYANSAGHLGQTRRRPPTAEMRYRRLFETATDGILIVDSDSERIVDANPHLLRILGYTHDQAVGRTLWELGALCDDALNRTAFRQLKHRGSLRHDDLSLESRDGSRLQVELSCSAYREGDRRVIQCNFRDITARKSAESISARTHGDLLNHIAELRLHDEELRRLARLHTLLQACATEDEAFQVVGPALGELFAGLGGGLAIRRSQLPVLDTVACWGEPALLEASFAPEACWSLRRGRLSAAWNARAGEVCRHFSRSVGTDSFCAPLTVEGEALGVVCFVEARTGNGSRPAGRETLAVTGAETIKLAVLNLRLRESLRDQANHDILTGLYNRRYLEDSLARELDRARRGQAPLCLAMLDLDHLKRYNDTFGHAAGDQYLRELGRVLRSHLRESDIACRYGGDEFALVLPDSSLADTEPRMEQIRAMVSRLGRPPMETCTVSIGVAEASRYDFDARELLQAADQALYAAKQGGRDRVSCCR